MTQSRVRTGSMFNLPTAGSLTFAGEMAALSAAFLWAFSSFLFSRLGNTIPPIEMNFLKGILAAALFTATLFILGDPVTNLTLQTVLILAVSGAIGIGFGDTMYFEALNLLGPRRTLLVTTLAPVFTALLAWVFLDETLNLLAVAGIFLTIAGIAWVITEQEKDSGQDSSHIRKGIFYAFLAAMTQAIGAVLSRWVLTGTQTSALHSALVRLVAGILFIVIWVAVKHQPVGQWVKTRSTPRLWARWRWWSFWALILQSGCNRWHSSTPGWESLKRFWRLPPVRPAYFRPAARKIEPAFDHRSIRGSGWNRADVPAGVNPLPMTAASPPQAEDVKQDADVDYRQSGDHK